MTEGDAAGQQRAKRQIKTPAKFTDVGAHPEAGHVVAAVSAPHARPRAEYGPAQLRLGAGPMRRVYRVLGRRDLTRGLKNREVHLFWPDDGRWYPAKFLKVRPGLGRPPSLR